MKVDRLKKRRQFLDLGNNCRKDILPAMIILSSKSANSSKVQIGFTASKKVGNAVVRAKAKRRMRAVVDEVIRLNDNFKTEGLAINIIARAYITNRDFSKMVREFKTFLEQEMKCEV